MEKLRSMIIKYKDVLLYLVFGGLTTLVSFLAYGLFYNLCNYSAAVSNVLSWIIAVVFAYLTNKPFVFKSNDWSAQTIIPELWKFVGCRIGSGLFETAFLAITVDFLLWNALGMKIVASVVVVVLNYIASKLFVFKRK